MEKNIAVIRGDGIGPEIVNATLQVLAAVGEKFGHKFNYTDVDMGGCSIDKHGVPLTEEAIAACRAIFGRNVVCLACARRWVCIPMCVRRVCFRSWILLRR